MSDTILNMDYRMVDTLNANQLEIDDLIDIDGEIVRIADIISLKEGYALTYENEFGEKDLVEISDDATFNLYILD